MTNNTSPDYKKFVDLFTELVKEVRQIKMTLQDERKADFSKFDAIEQALTDLSPKPEIDLSDFHVDLEAELYFLSHREGGRQGFVLSGYRPTFLFEGAYWGIFMTLLETEKAYPGETYLAGIQFKFAEPILSGQLKIGQGFCLTEGGRIVARGVIAKIVNPVLDYWDADTFSEQARKDGLITLDKNDLYSRIEAIIHENENIPHPFADAMIQYNKNNLYQLNVVCFLSKKFRFMDFDLQHLNLGSSLMKRYYFEGNDNYKNSNPYLSENRIEFDTRNEQFYLTGQLIFVPTYYTKNHIDMLLRINSKRP